MGLTSELNERFAIILKGTTLPKPAREYRFDLKHRWAWDFAWPECMVALDIQGGTWNAGGHVRGKGYENDCRKYSTASILGWTIILATTDMVESGEVLALLEKALASRTSVSTLEEVIKFNEG